MHNKLPLCIVHYQFILNLALYMNTNQLSLDLMNLASQIATVFKDVRKDIQGDFRNGIRPNRDPYISEPEAYEDFEQCSEKLSNACRVLAMRLNRAALIESPESLPENKLKSICHRLRQENITERTGEEAADLIERLAASLNIQ